MTPDVPDCDLLRWQDDGGREPDDEVDVRETPDEWYLTYDRLRRMFG